MDLLMIHEGLISMRNIFKVSADSDPERLKWCKQLKDIIDVILRNEELGTSL
jgi:hypothetical protein